MGNDVRAVLSPSYRRRDNLEVMINAVLPTLLSDEHKWDVRSCNVTDAKMYIKFTTEVEHEIKVGQTVRFGGVITNGEVGNSTTSVQPFVETLQCTNGMTIPKWSIRSTHLGRTMDFDGEIFEDDTMKADDQAFMLKMRDAISSVSKDELVNEMVEEMKSAADEKYSNDQRPKDSVEELSKRFNFNENEEDSILEHFLSGNDSSRWGMVSAITRTAQDVTDYDRASEMESFGGQLLINRN